MNPIDQAKADITQAASYISSLPIPLRAATLAVLTARLFADDPESASTFCDTVLELIRVAHDAEEVKRDFDQWRAHYGY